ncbi:MAG: hypothetical protein AB3X41_04155 [Leptothrix ochracea]|uniref:hypothetical protein n=1 Tax=Leptothrix ochracea TaxID=735331 RepID=UPI0034E258BB
MLAKARSGTNYPLGVPHRPFLGDQTPTHQSPEAPPPPPLSELLLELLSELL